MWTTITSLKDWLAYKNDLAAKLSFSPQFSISWGNDPQAYPCLVSTLLPSRSGGMELKAYTAFVYPADCEELLKLTERKPTPVAATTAVSPNQNQFNRWVAAELLTVVHYLVETGLCAPRGGLPANVTAFEDKLLEMIEMVDQYHSEDKANKVKVASYQKTVLDTLEPPV